MQVDRAPQVFISYAREDASHARRLFDSLRAAGAQPWLDVEDLLPGQNWETEIEKALKRADFVIALLSSPSLEKRGFIQKELRYVLSILDEIPEGQVFLIPARLDDCRPEHRKLRELNWVDLFPDFEVGFRKILQVVRPPRMAQAGILDSAFIADEQDLGQAGWGVIFHESADRAVRDALAPLLELRRSQATGRDPLLYREFVGPAGYAKDETALQFLARQGMGPGAPDPKRVPSYLLLVGEPTAIPFEFQYDLGVQYRVGRLAFTRVEQYAHYAQSVVDVEVDLPDRGYVTLFSVTHVNDRATNVALQQLTRPVGESLARQMPAWKFEMVTGSEATKKSLGDLLSARGGAHFLFVVGHGLNFPAESTRRLAEQCGVLCADWGGGRTTAEHTFGALDVDPSWDLRGLIVWLFTEFGAGASGRHESSRPSVDVAKVPVSLPLVSPLCQAFLGRKNGALAVVGHVDTTRTTSFTWPGVGTQTQTFESAIRVILEGQPVASALRYFSAKYSELAALYIQRDRQGTAGESTSRHLWAAMIDARNQFLLGDPATRMAARPLQPTFRPGK